MTPITTTGVDVRSRAHDNSTFPILRGVRTHVQTWQPQGSPVATVIAHHHHYGSATTFTAVGERLAADGVRLVAFDRLGFGLTERVEPEGRFVGPDAPYTRAFAVEQTRELLDLLEVDKAIVTGTSMGGTTAIQFALAHPDRVAHLVPVAAALTGDSSAPMWLRPLLRREPMVTLGARLVRRRAPVAATAERITRSWLDPSRATAADVAAHLGFIGVDGWDRGLLYALVSDEQPDLPPLLGKLITDRVPVTAVGGTADPIIRPRFIALVAAATEGTPVLLECGHVVQQECPDGLARILLGIAHEAAAS